MTCAPSASSAASSIQTTCLSSQERTRTLLAGRPATCEYRIRHQGRPDPLAARPRAPVLGPGAGPRGAHCRGGTGHHQPEAGGAGGAARPGSGGGVGAPAPGPGGGGGGHGPGERRPGRLRWSRPSSTGSSWSRPPTCCPWTPPASSCSRTAGWWWRRPGASRTRRSARGPSRMDERLRQRWPKAGDPPLYCPDMRLVPGRTPREPWVGEHEVRSIITVPLAIDGELVGVFDVASTRPDFYTERHVRIAAALGDRVTQALRNARLYAAEQERSRVAEELARLRQEQARGRGDGRGERGPRQRPGSRHRLSDHPRPGRAGAALRPRRDRALPGRLGGERRHPGRPAHPARDAAGADRSQHQHLAGPDAAASPTIWPIPPRCPTGRISRPGAAPIASAA